MSSTTDFTQYTPETSGTTVDGDVWDGRRFTIPWPGNTYHIFEKGTNRAILMNDDGGAYIYDIDQDIVKHNVWLCVEKNGYFGFTQLGRYLGHTINGHIHAGAYNLEDWEYITVRKHPEGGYQMLTPHWWYSLKVICLDGDGPNLVLRDHGTTTWEFVKAG